MRSKKTFALVLGWLAPAIIALFLPGASFAQGEDVVEEVQAEAAAEVSEPGNAQPVEPKESPLKANAGVNALINTGNSSSQNLGANTLISYKWDRNKLEHTAAGAYGRAKDNSTGVTSTNTKNWRTALRYDRYILTPLSTFALGHIGADEPAGFDLKYGGAAGLAHELWKKVPDYFKYEAGFDFTREERISAANENIYSARIFLRYTREISSWAKFGQDVENLINVEAASDYRLNTLTTLTMKLTDKIAFQVGYEVRFDNQPVPGFKKTDTKTQLGLVVDFI